MSIEKSLIVAATILAFAYIISPIALQAFKMKQCTDAGRDADRCFLIMNTKK